MTTDNRKQPARGSRDTKELEEMLYKTLRTFDNPTNPRGSYFVMAYLLALLMSYVPLSFYSMRTNKSIRRV